MGVWYDPTTMGISRSPSPLARADPDDPRENDAKNPAGSNNPRRFSNAVSSDKSIIIIIIIIIMSVLIM